MKVSQGSSRGNLWKDVPRRLVTVSFGVPSVMMLLCYSTTAWLFFQGAHCLCLIEWMEMIPLHCTETECRDQSETGGNESTEAIPLQRKTILKLLSRMFPNKYKSMSSLERRQLYLFSFFSMLITVVRTSLLPMAIIFAFITLRLSLYLPTSGTTFLLHSNESMQIIQHYQFGLIYMSLGFHFLIRIHQVGGPAHAGCLLFVVWMSDTGALVVGRLMRKEETKKNNAYPQHVFLSFIKSISPGKTLPGVIAAIVTGPISLLLYPMDLPNSSTSSHGDVLYQNNPLFEKVLLGLLLSLAGIIGDLVESSVKRMSQKKDSGGLLPGHGGVVDRFDSLFTAGVVYYYWVLAH